MTPAALLRILAVTTALLGLSRVVSMIAVGEPHPIFVAATVVEFVVAGLTYWYSTMPQPHDPG